MAGYGDDTAFAAWLTANGYTLPVGAPAPAILRQRGSAYVDGLYGSRARGVPTGGYAQERAWPRIGATAYASAIPDDAIPAAWIEASYHAGLYEAENPGGLAVVVTGAGAIKMEQVGSLKTEYFEGSADAIGNATPMLSAVEGLLGPFLIPTDSAPSLGIWSIGGRCA